MSEKHTPDEAKLTRTMKAILQAMQNGATLWRYSGQRSGWLLRNVINSHYQWRVRVSTITKMEEAGLIEEDTERSIYRESASACDIHYKLKHTKATADKEGK